MAADHSRIRAGIYILAAALLAGLLALKGAGVGERLLIVLAVASGSLVALLLITYRALVAIVHAARNGQPGRSPDDEEGKG